MSSFKQFISFALLLGAFSFSALGQNSALIPYEGAMHMYSWNGLLEGSSYEFYVSSNADGSGIYDDVTTPEFDFLSGSSGIVASGQSTVSINISWNSGASLNSYYLWIKASANDGCSNYRYIGVSPRPNNRSINFGITASTECFNLTNNGFTIAFITEDNNGQPIPAAYFPLQVEFTVNGAPQSQLLSYNDQQLQITDVMFSAMPDQNTPVEVVLTSVTDVKNAPVQPGANRTHLRTIFAIPEIEFTEELRRQYYDKEGITASNSFDSRAHRVEPK